MKRIPLFVLAVLVGVILGTARGVNYDPKTQVITGRIVESASGKPIANLTVKLTPPKTVKDPQKLTATNQQGEFRFDGVKPGRYLVEVSQGLNVIYRQVFDSSQPKDEPIKLTVKTK